ncbi:cysteine--1-D-myo-inosityl 2-amino-2-deoxy-alpha-D-glucopyranoside ligase [Mycetocola reblochoni]|uniref:L-cysteine:1D-myo-inositol 2-amino-2-deoxy-alpha-D-glucopyranoside ligase n=2 Tax=Mycetocola reblochoni TaxID=331618 RepID=A0A1R4J6H7_9MICO|nr:cysteine--1-D-myo-inosityl 2-amino-2-deoxy-alpha-D-glucopyranoside ligase [Mycetocola reblochoni]RLP69586.1 cysteine--1-D-myo-inosityl 2-amino-2-deoxy-alpha-D-glucopyranoside ligase [Mycetocola reblochoni]SJN27405.1 L-cysteine:1D-myo-inosityl 2-amino-2-deoxy-alpha-D-glucopyranoside ligase MshC [Mycetocola reblochoni REB411]
MPSWTSPHIPVLPGVGLRPRLHDTARDALVDPVEGDTATLYVCGITPYDATHLGHAATYLAFDVLRRVWQDAGVDVTAAQNVTDVDDPLLERAEQRGLDWRELAESQTRLYREDMTALGVIPPEHFVRVTDAVQRIADAAAELERAGIGYRVATDDADGDDLYLSVDAARNAYWHLGATSRLDLGEMIRLSAERGGDPQREGKRHVLDPLLWRAAREGEPSWTTAAGHGRPGWHVECAVIATEALGAPVTVQGGGSDLVFPHHELSAAHASNLTPAPFAAAYLHTGMVGLDGEKMSKSLGNLVLVSELRAAGVAPALIRLALLERHYRADQDWSDARLDSARDRSARWSVAFRTAERASPTLPAAVETTLRSVREALADDLDTPRALAILDEAAERGTDDTGVLRHAVLALLGVALPS